MTAHPPSTSTPDQKFILLQFLASRRSTICIADLATHMGSMQVAWQFASELVRELKVEVEGDAGSLMYRCTPYGRRCVNQHNRRQDLETSGRVLALDRLRRGK